MEYNINKATMNRTSASHYLGLILLLVLSFKLGYVQASGSCKESSLCCNGRDSSCVVQKAPLNAIIEDLNDKPCYCDHACLKLGDCCDDFKAHCGVSDCVVNEWGLWSECDVTCGTGIMSRNRTVTVEPKNGGKHCPSLVQKRGCQGTRCHHHHDKRVLRESALLLPSKLSKSRRANDTNDIRRNLRLRESISDNYNRDREYCIEFEVIKATKSCHKIEPYNLLAEGERITVRCDLEALIKEQNDEEILSNSSILDEEPLKKLKYHCRGEGLPARMTRFSALAVPSCRGKWLRLTEKKTKKCTESQFIFI